MDRRYGVIRSAASAGYEKARPRSRRALWREDDSGAAERSRVRQSHRMKDVGEDRGEEALCVASPVQTCMHRCDNSPSRRRAERDVHCIARRETEACGGPCCWTRENGRVFFLCCCCPGIVPTAWLLCCHQQLRLRRWSLMD